MSRTVQNEDLFAFISENRNPVIKDVVFNRCDFSNLNLSHRTFTKVYFDYCNFSTTTFYKTRFIKVGFRGLPGGTIFSGQTDFSETIFDEFSKIRLGYVLETYMEKLIDERSENPDYNEESFEAFLPIGISSLFPSRCPIGCDFIGYKEVTVKDDDGYSMSAIAKLLIPASATSVSGFSARCRTTEAKVLEIFDNYKGKKYKIAVSKSGAIRPGDTLHPKRFYKNRFLVSSDDIDFALTPDGASDYYHF